MTAISVTTSNDPSPLELIFATKIRNALEHADYATKARKVEGCFGIKSAKDPQSVSFNCVRGDISLSSGLSADCQIVITLDFDKPEHRPKIKGLLKHPWFSLNVGKLLEFPTRSWSDAFKRFWERHQEYPGMPSGITLKCLDEDRRLSVGTDDVACYFEAKSEHLAEAFSGDTPFVQLLMAGKIKGRYTFEQIVVLSDVTLQMMLGDA